LITGPGGLLTLSLVIGVGAGLGAVLFRYLIEGFTYLFTGHSSYGVEGHVANPLVPGLGIWFVALVPIVGGLLYGPLVERFASEARGHGVPEVMYAVARKGGRIRPIVAVVKSLASALCIGSGGSVGREGPIVQIGSALGSTLGQITKAPEARMRLLVACGAAGGISATFNAPIAGVFFALEVILRDFETRSFSAVVVASVTADVIGRAAFGSEAFLKLPHVGVGAVAGYPLYLVLGLLAAVVGVFFIRFLYAASARAPMTAILIIFELTGDYRIMLPLMLAVVIATALANRLSPDSIYTLKLARRGIDLLRRRPASPMEAITVAEAMRPTPEPVPGSASLDEAIERLSATDEPTLPVTDESGAFLGVLLDDELEQALGEEAGEADAASLARQLPTLSPTESLAEATATLVKTDSAGLAVLDEKGDRVVGWLSHRDILRVYDQRMKLERARKGGAAKPPRNAAPTPA
jgi:H+/Cl- antiporter ClcA